MQPMGHYQLVRNLVDFRLDPQSALNAPRWYVNGVEKSQSAEHLTLSEVSLEYGYGGEFDGGISVADLAEGGDGGGKQQVRDVAAGLRARGHMVGPAVCGDKRSLYGRGQIILRNNETGVLWGGSDPRADGCAMVVP